jgi:cation diffusion facilitator CzcD-associated flavoprotein CzcO
MREVPVVIVGGGVAGIACARTLQARGVDSPQLLPTTTLTQLLRRSTYLIYADLTKHLRLS